MKIKLSTTLTKNIFVAVTALFSVTACTEELPGVGSIPDLTPPSANFSYKSSTENFKQIDFTNLSISASNFTWDFADGNTSEEQEPSNVFPGEGSYDVMLKATDGNGVQSDTVITVSIVDELVPEFACKSFECKDRSVWGSFSGSDSPTPPDGETGAKLESATHVLDQTIKVTGGVTYNVSFHYVSASSSGTACGNFLLEDPDNGVTFVEEGIELTPNASDYVYKSFIIETAVNTKNLRFYLLPGDVTGRYDLVEIKKVD